MDGENSLYAAMAHKHFVAASSGNSVDCSEIKRTGESSSYCAADRADESAYVSTCSKGKFSTETFQEPKRKKMGIELPCHIQEATSRLENLIKTDNESMPHKSFLEAFFKPQVELMKENEELKQKNLRYEFFKKWNDTIRESYTIIRHSLQGEYIKQTRRHKDITSVFRDFSNQRADEVDQKFVLDICQRTRRTPDTIREFMERPDKGWVTTSEGRKWMDERNIHVHLQPVYDLKKLAGKEVNQDDVAQLFFEKKQDALEKYRELYNKEKDVQFKVLEMQVDFLKKSEIEVLDYNPLQSTQ